MPRNPGEVLVHQPQQSKTIVRFSIFEVDIDSAEVRKNGVKLKIQDQPFQILSVLLSRRGEIVSREDLQKKLWPDGTFVDFEHSVNTAIKKLRETLGDDADSPRFIETVPRRGYRFIAPIHDQRIQEEGLTENRTHPPFNRKLIILSLLIVLLVLSGALLWWGHPDQAGPKVARSQKLTYPGQIQTLGNTEALLSIQTDGRRIYYTDKIGQIRFVGVTGAEEGHIQLDDISVVILHISPDGLKLLVRQWPGSQGTSEGPIWIVPTSGAPRQRLGDIEAQDAAWSPDGKFIAFAQGFNIFVADSTGSNARKLNAFPGRPFWLRWSPDGKQLRFTLNDPKTGVRTLWQTDLNGRSKQLLANWKGARNTCCGVWSPDGKGYLFLNWDDEQSQLWEIPQSRFLRDGPNPVLINAPSDSPVIAVTSSPLEQKLFLLGCNPLNELYAVRPRDKRILQPFPKLPILRASFSRDGKWMAFYSSTKKGLWSARSDGSNQLQLTSSPLQVFMSVFSPDSSRIALMGNIPDQPVKVYWVSSQGGALHELPTDVLNQADPNWTSDGESIIFGEPPHFWADSGKTKAIYVSNLKTGVTTKIPGSEGWFSPRISPDGHSLAAVSLDLQRIGLFDFETGRWRDLPQPTGIDNPFFSADGQWVYFNNGDDDRVLRLRVKDGHTESVLSFGALLPNDSCFATGFSPEQNILLSCLRTSSDLYALDWN